jgi:hypothetical protein
MAPLRFRMRNLLLCQVAAQPWGENGLMEVFQFIHRLTRSVFASAPYNSSAELAEDFVVATTNSRDVWIQWYKSRLKTLKLGKWSCYVALCGINHAVALHAPHSCSSHLAIKVCRAMRPAQLTGLSWAGWRHRLPQWYCENRKKDRQVVNHFSKMLLHLSGNCYT